MEFNYANSNGFFTIATAEINDKFSDEEIWQLVNIFSNARVGGALPTKTYVKEEICKIERR